MSNTKIQEVELSTLEVEINNKISSFVNKYHQYPKYLKLPLWLSNCMKREMRKIVFCNLDYDTGLLQYRNLIVCETVVIEKLEEIEVF